jgi:hypothetical protein
MLVLSFSILKCSTSDDLSLSACKTTVGKGCLSAVLAGGLTFDAGNWFNVPRPEFTGSQTLSIDNGAEFAFLNCLRYVTSALDLTCYHSEFHNLDYRVLETC